MPVRPAAIEPSEFPWFEYRHYSFSLGLTHSTGIYLSGHSASEHDPGSGHMVVRGSMADQARTAYAKIAALLEAAGSGLEHVTHLVENVTVDGLASYGEAAAVREEVFAGTSPVVSTVVVRRLLRPEALLEVEVTAAPPSGRPDSIDTGVVVLPTLLPLDDGGDVVSPGDLTGQTDRVLERAAEMLGAVGLGLDHVVKTLDFTTPATRTTYPKTGRVRRDRLGPVYPGAAGILMPRLAHPDALLALEVTASRHDPVAVNPGWERYAKLSYSPAVRAGPLLFCSGLAALDPETERAVFPGDVVAQAELTYEHLLQVLGAAGAGPSALVRTVEYVTPDGLADYRAVGRVRDRLLQQPFPASTGLVCEGLLRPEFLLEVDPMAVLA
ncbi:MAG: RidA family protein [Acidimicrobiales bacterium]